MWWGFLAGGQQLFSFSKGGGYDIAGLSSCQCRNIVQSHHELVMIALVADDNNKQIEKRLDPYYAHARKYLSIQESYEQCAFARMRCKTDFDESVFCILM